MGQLSAHRCWALSWASVDVKFKLGKVSNRASFDTMLFGCQSVELFVILAKCSVCFVTKTVKY